MTLSPEHANATSRAHAVASLLRLGKALRLQPLAALPTPLRSFVRGVAARRRAGAFMATHDVGPLRCPPGLMAAQRSALVELRDRLGSAGIGAYLEFGVADASSLTSMYRVLQELELGHVRLFGFDPFDKQEPRDPDTAVQLKVTRAILRRHKIKLCDVVLTRTPLDRLSTELRDRHLLTPTSIITVNCGQAASTSHVLRFCEPLLLGEAALFLHNARAEDERADGERVALDSFLRQHPDLSLRELGRYGTRGEAFILRRNLPV